MIFRSVLCLYFSFLLQLNVSSEGYNLTKQFFTGKFPGIYWSNNGNKLENLYKLGLAALPLSWFSDITIFFVTKLFSGKICLKHSFNILSLRFKYKNVYFENVAWCSFFNLYIKMLWLLCQWILWILWIYWYLGFIHVACVDIYHLTIHIIF